MSLYTKLQSFYRTDREVKYLFLKAYFLSAVVKFTLVFLPFKKIMNWQGIANVETPMHPDQDSLTYRKSIQSAIRLCDIYTCWKTECYTQALTAKILLKSKGIPSTVYIGFQKNDDGTYKGHAWLRSYDIIITGNLEKELFTVHTFYS